MRSCRRLLNKFFNLVGKERYIAGKMGNECQNVHSPPDLHFGSHSFDQGLSTRMEAVSPADFGILLPRCNSVLWLTFQDWMNDLPFCSKTFVPINNNSIFFRWSFLALVFSSCQQAWRLLLCKKDRFCPSCDPSCLSGDDYTQIHTYSTQSHVLSQYME